MIKGLAHICFTVNNLDASLKFYCDQLGMQQAFDFTSPEGKRTGVYIHAGARTFVELFENPAIADQQPPRTSTYQHFCLEVDNFDQMVDKLRQAGIQVDGVKLGIDNSWQAWIIDPDHNRIELHGYTDKSRQQIFLDKTHKRTAICQPDA